MMIARRASIGGLPSQLMTCSTSISTGCGCTASLRSLATLLSHRVMRPSPITWSRSSVKGTATSAIATVTSTMRNPKRSSADALSRRTGRRRWVPSIGAVGSATPASRTSGMGQLRGLAVPAVADRPVQPEQDQAYGEQHEQPRAIGRVGHLAERAVEALGLARVLLQTGPHQEHTDEAEGDPSSYVADHTGGDDALALGLVDPAEREAVLELPGQTAVDVPEAGADHDEPGDHDDRLAARDVEHLRGPLLLGAAAARLRARTHQQLDRRHGEAAVDSSPADVAGPLRPRLLVVLTRLASRREDQPPDDVDDEPDRHQHEQRPA